MKLFGKRILGLLCISLIIYSCEKDNDDVAIVEQQYEASAYKAQVVVAWYGLIKTLTTETPGYTPPVAARAFGYTGIALYEAIVPGMPDKNSLSGKLTDLQINIALDSKKTYHWPTVANAVLAKMTKHFYANTTQERLAAMAQLEKITTMSFWRKTDRKCSMPRYCSRKRWRILFYYGRQRMAEKMASSIIFLRSIHLLPDRSIGYLHLRGFCPPYSRTGGLTDPF